MTQPELRAAIVQDADSGRVLMLAWMDDEALAAHARDGRGALLEPLAAAALAQGRDVRQHARGRGAARRLRRRRDPPARAAERAGVPHGLASRASRRGSGARSRERALERPPRARTSPACSTAGRRRRAQKVGEEGVEVGARRASARATSGSSRSSPTSGSTCTCCSRRAGLDPSPRSRTSCAAVTPSGASGIRAGEGRRSRYTRACTSGPDPPPARLQPNVEKRTSV